MPLSPTTLDLLDAAAASLRHASHVARIGERHRAAGLGALRTAAALVGERTARRAPDPTRAPDATHQPIDLRPPRRAGVTGPGIWVVLPGVAPELGEWADLFAAADLRRRGLAGPHPLTAREADDLLRAAEEFLLTAQGLLDLPRQPVVTTLTPLRVA